MRLRLIVPAAALGLSLATAACRDDGLAPREVPVDRVNCSHCGMLVSDLAHAAQVVAVGEEPRFYDDIGCLRADGRPLGEGVRAYVRIGDGWVDVERAWFGRPPAARTPMGSGLEAFLTAEEARRADRAGGAMTWSEVTQVMP